ncbi:wd repeat protein [Anaeramoeba flamelloides]|uniref:Wd repeat protein n=1 Tax=Anaeramoeba flamelloides TaxID=1746091 RepID=A0ABQ8Y7K7_9EUKA|nr:wd repeat protein [Anaeramoeba flamelloides]
MNVNEEENDNGVDRGQERERFRERERERERIRRRGRGRGRRGGRGRGRGRGRERALEGGSEQTRIKINLRSTKTRSCKSFALENSNLKSKFNQKTTIAHRQLRDLLSCPKPFQSTIESSSSPLYFPFNESIYSLDQRTLDCKSIKNCEFGITTVSVMKNLICAGSADGNVMIKDLQRENFLIKKAFGAGIINSVTITNDLPLSDYSTHPTLIVSSNDKMVRIVKVRNARLSVVKKIRFPKPINHSSVSPNGNIFLAVGDTKEAILCDPRNGYKLISRIKAMKDSSFATDWNPLTSTQFAIGSQEGAALIFDIRKLNNALAKIKSTQNAKKERAIRNVKFSSNHGLLLIAEHRNRVNLLDTRNYRDIQTIQLDPNDGDLNISGACFGPNSEFVYISTTQKIIKIPLDVRKRRLFSCGSFK